MRAAPRNPSPPITANDSRAFEAMATGVKVLLHERESA
jgi:hypothetical protein